MAVAVVNNDMPISSSAASTSRIEVRSVWAHNLDEEFALIRSAVPFHPFVALDTEYPGVVVASKNPYCTLTLPQRYELIRANVEALRIIQVGLTLSDAAGNLPCAIYSDGTCVRYVWEFNFRDFDINRDRYAPSSVELLKANGIDFQKNQIWGIDSWASTVRVERAVGSRHQSGSDSLLTWQVFYQIASRVNPQLIDRPEHMGTLYDLQLQ
ncbi:probable CCR4-associated factor 1 homolog 11 [Zingiber officinale]|uniref:Uncharacterized protein n=1 Tax=Zingiber officinale TaxID=94328 RepID=A0A8J5KPV5_ZINOF|nr:probable CCR4-associated factor 1 homolog 11 [Zingiber officinale]KAG6486724.1 hypothetical protein ZIOFF_055303 [Zingiber officinale]